VTVGELPAFVRAGFYAALLGALAVTDLLADEVLASLIVLAGFLFLLLPIAVRLFGRRRRPMPRATTRDVVAFAAALTVLAAIEAVLIPDFGLGAIFWIVAVIIPSVEFLGYFARREDHSR
jgi:uncharacterized Tic20 family protein